MAKQAAKVKAEPVALSPSDLLAAAAASATPSAKEAAAKAPRVILALSETEVDHFNHLVQAREIRKISETAEDTEDVFLKDILLQKYVDLYWSSKQLPENPEVVTYLDADQTVVNNRAIFTVKAIFRPTKSLPPVKDREPGKGIREYLVEALTTGKNAIGEDVANAILDTEVQIEKGVSIRQLNSLFNGSYIDNVWTPATEEQRAAATKLLSVILASSVTKMTTFGPFTPEERAILLEEDTENIKVKDAKGFLKRFRTYAKNKGQLRHLFDVFSPDLSWSGFVFAQNALPSDNPRLDAAKEILGMKEPMPAQSPS